MNDEVGAFRHRFQMFIVISETETLDVCSWNGVSVDGGNQNLWSATPGAARTVRDAGISQTSVDFEP